MTWTILILVIAIALFAFGGMLISKLGKKDSDPIAVYSKKAIAAIAVVLTVVGVNRLGLGTAYYLTESNPMILQTMAQNMQQQRSSGASNKDIRRHVKRHGAEMIMNAPVLGNENADMKRTIFVFTVPTCPYCQRVHKELDRVIESRDDVRVVVKNFSIHGVLSDDATRAMIAAKLQGNDKAVALTNHLMVNRYWPEDTSKNQDKLPETIHKNIMEIAKKLGLDTERLAADMRGEVVHNELAQVRELAEKFGINGTPYLIIGDQAFPGAIPYDQIMNALN
ncbi:MAG: DsbA family protein [Alphaproteobacteria bacterium]|nr:DsbA family protein [Alphaproteobacteria bacterium]